MKNPLIVILILVIFAVAIFSFTRGVDAYIPPQNPAEIAAISVGDTVLSGQNVVSSSKVRKVPLLYHPEYLIEDLESKEYNDFYTALTTGAVETPITEITGGNISRYGNAVGFNGPGMVAVNGSKLVVNPPNTFVWGFITPYTVAVKTANGIDIKTQNVTVKSVATADISNSTIPTKYVTVKKLKDWYTYAKVGDSIGLDFSLSNFSDGRNSVMPDKIANDFGNYTVQYMSEYPSGSPVMVYNAATTKNVVGSGQDTLGYYAQYDNALRAVNAKVFVQGWNNTIVPPHTSASGKDDVTFQGVYDPSTNSYPSHGACPPGRALRSAVMEAGCPLPTGMSSGFYSVELSSSPSSGIFVYNPTNYPIKIVIWTEGSGTGMQLFAQAIQYKP